MSHGNDLLDDQVFVQSADGYEYGRSLVDETRASVTIEPVSKPNRIVEWAVEGETKRTIVAGSRSITSVEVVEHAMHDAPPQWMSWSPSELVHGGATGVDTSADEIARRDGSSWDIVTTFEPRWSKFGPAAGPVRNEAMVDYADALIAVWDGSSTGTRDIIGKALDSGLDVFVVQR